MRGRGAREASAVGYLRKRVTELASPATRAVTDPLATWAQGIRLDGRPFSFEGHEYLRAIYDDTARHVILSKAAQIGGTTWALLRAIHACLTGLDVIYFFPTRTDVLDFSKSRVGPLLDENPFLARKMTDTDTAGLKRIGDAHLHFRGMLSKVGLKGTPADLIIFDELDEATPEAKTMARERIAHSDYKRVIELSNPSLPDYGIDAAYQRSDQRHWTLRCPSCGKWTALDKEFPQKLGEEVRVILPRADGTFYRACVHCGGELNLDVGEWVADYPDRESHGYRISQLFSEKVDPGEILREYRETRFPARFYNLKVGIPWADLDRRLDEATVLGLCGEHVMAEAAEEGGISMGVDTGRALHTVVLERIQGEGGDRKHQRVIHLGVYRDFRELDAAMERFGVSRCVIDGLPETHSARDFAGRHPHKVCLNFFNEHQRGSAKWDWQEAKVEINRTEALDASRAAVRDGLLVLPRQTPIVGEFARHMASDAKVLDEDEDTGAKRYRYIKTGEDHFSLAFTYAWMASQEVGGEAAVFISGYTRAEIDRMIEGPPIGSWDCEREIYREWERHVNPFAREDWW